MNSELKENQTWSTSRFVGYAGNSKAFRFSSVPRPSLRIPNETEDILVPKEVVTQQIEPELRKSKRNRTSQNFGPGFQLYLIKGIMDEMDSIMGNGVGSRLQTSWLQMDLQKKNEVARISTIRLLIALALIHNLIIHQMNVKTTFLNGELDEEVYMNQPQGFIMPGNENKCCYISKGLCQMYNGKSIHLGVMYNMIRELIMNGVVSIEFVRSQQNLADYLTNGLAGDLVLKSTEGMGLKSN
ncbi:zinc finger, CCHC-type containing protein [Tanacetum coccineum]